MSHQGTVRNDGDSTKIPPGIWNFWPHQLWSTVWGQNTLQRCYEPKEMGQLSNRNTNSGGWGMDEIGDEN